MDCNHAARVARTSFKLKVLTSSACWPMQFDQHGSTSTSGRAVRPEAIICLLRGKAFESSQNRQRAAACFKQALGLDAYCYDAFR